MGSQALLQDGAFSVENIRKSFNSGARGYLFYFTPEFPDIGGDMETKKATFLVRSTTIPTSNINEIIVPWQGHQYKIAGTQSFTDWSVTFNCDAQTKIFEKYMYWLDLMHNGGTSVHGDPSKYLKDQKLQMLDLDGKTGVLNIQLIGAYPKTVDAITLDYSAVDIAQFSVTFNYQYHVINDKIGKYEEA